MNNTNQQHKTLSRELSRLGFNAFEEHADVKTAKDLCRRAIELDPANDGAFLNLGKILGYPYGYEKEAIKCINAALKINSKNIEAHYISGWQKKEQKEKIRAWKNAVNITPETADDHTYIGLSLEQLDLKEDALNSHYKAISLDPEHPIALNELASHFYVAGKNETHVDTALDQLNKAASFARRIIKAAEGKFVPDFYKNNNKTLISFCEKQIQKLESPT